MRVLYLIVLATALAISGCGDLGGDTRQETKPIIVAQSQIDRYPEGTPARAFLAWFRAMQRRDARTVARYYAARLGLTPADIARQRRRAAYAFDPLAPPRILATKERGSRATVTTLFRTGGIAPNGRVDILEKNPVSFALERERGAWRLSSTTFLDFLARKRADQ